MDTILSRVPCFNEAATVSPKLYSNSSYVELHRKKKISIKACRAKARPCTIKEILMIDEIHWF